MANKHLNGKKSLKVLSLCFAMLCIVLNFTACLKNIGPNFIDFHAEWVLEEEDFGLKITTSGNGANADYPLGTLTIDGTEIEVVIFTFRPAVGIRICDLSQWEYPPEDGNDEYNQWYNETLPSSTILSGRYTGYRKYVEINIEANESGNPDYDKYVGRTFRLTRHNL